MNIKIKNELLVIDILSLLLIAIITLTELSIIRIILGLSLILFFPGYTLIAALFPRKQSLDSIERIALSFGLSIAVVPLIGLILNYTPWGIRLYPILVSLTGFILGMSSIAWYKRSRLLEQERLRITLNIDFSKLRGTSKLDKVLSVVLICTIFAAIGTLIYVIATPKIGERFTEFYILGLSGKAEGYPKEIVVGEPASVILGMVNQEHEAVEYKVKINIEGKTITSLNPIFLEHEQRWEKEVSFTATILGKNLKVEFLLYKKASSQIDELNSYRELHLWVDVVEGRSSFEL